MISPDKRIIWKAVGYQPGYFLGMADALNGLKQDNSANLSLVIQKVNATATVENATREAGQPNPEFSLVFDGIVNDEIVPVWLEEPVFTCEADENSPEGEYPITVTATAESYKLTFVAGTLTVTPSTTGIVSVNADAKTKSDVIFDLSGRRVSESAMNKGLYIRNGKKIVRK
jgi:hypothetical protein